MSTLAQASTWCFEWRQHELADLVGEIRTGEIRTEVDGQIRDGNSARFTWLCPEPHAR